MLESSQLGGRRCSVHLHIYIAKDSGIGTLCEKENQHGRPFVTANDDLLKILVNP